MQSDQAPASACPPNSDDQYGLPLTQAITAFVPSDLLKRVDAARAVWKAAGSPLVPNNLPHMLAGGDRTLVRKPHTAIAELGNAWMACAEALQRSLRFAELEAHKCADLVAGTWEWLRPGAWDYLKIGFLVATYRPDGVPTPFVSQGPRQRLHVRVRRFVTDVSSAPMDEGLGASTCPPKGSHKTAEPGRKEFPTEGFDAEFWEFRKSQRSEDEETRHMLDYAADRVRSNKNPNKAPSNGWCFDQLRRLRNLVTRSS